MASPGTRNCWCRRPRESGQTEVYVQPFPDGPGRTVISLDGGRLPRWSADGKELLFVGRNGMMAVSVDDAATLAFGPPVQLFSWSFHRSRAGYDVANDGRLLFAPNVGATDDRQARLVLWTNWTAVLEQSDR